MKRHCLDCGTLTTQTRCPTCRSTHRQQRYGGNWRDISKAAIAAHPYCTRCGTTSDLTLDHVTSGTVAHGVQVLCRPCNSAKK